MSNLADFVDRYIEGYLMGDLENMSKITQPAKNNAFGLVGYPMVGSIVSGMELLGGILMPAGGKYNPKGMRTNFRNYWDNFFIKEFPEYTGLADIIYSLVRNGISHSFVAKPGVKVAKAANWQAIRINQTYSEIQINPNELFEVFKKSFDNQAKPVLQDASRKAELEVRIAYFMTEFSLESATEFKKLAKISIHPSIIATLPAPSTVNVSLSGV